MLSLSVYDVWHVWLFFPRKDNERGLISYICRTNEILFVNQTVLISTSLRYVPE